MGVLAFVLEVEDEKLVLFYRRFVEDKVKVS